MFHVKHFGFVSRPYKLGELGLTGETNRGVGYEPTKDNIQMGISF